MQSKVVVLCLHCCRPRHHNANAALCSTEPQAETVSALEQQLASGAPLVCVLGQQPGPSRQLAYLKAVLSTLLGNANTSSSSASATSAASAPPAIQGHTSGLQATLPHAAASPLAGDGSVAPVWKPRQHQHWQRALQPHVRAIVICPSQQAAFQAHELAFDLARHVQGRQRVKVQLVSTSAAAQLAVGTGLFHQCKLPLVARCLDR
jgi:hypothetical protein